MKGILVASSKFDLNLGCLTLKGFLQISGEFYRLFSLNPHVYCPYFEKDLTVLNLKESTLLILHRLFCNEYFF